MDVEDNENRRLIFIIMKGILTPEEKQYLRRTSNYLRSLGMREGLIEIEMESWEDRINHEDIRWNDIKGFSNNYSADIPQGLYPILKKVVEYVDSLNNLNNNIDDISIQRIEIRIECDDKQIVVSHEIFYYDRGEQNSIGYDSDEDIERFKKWMNEDLKDVEVPSSGVLTIQYNGGGDSGYIENSFDETGNEIPAGIEDWCYQELENHFGGWEINEGSDGRFIFDFNEFTVFLDHTYNTEEQQIDTLYEENFDK
jgi:hypothetical protein